MRYLRTLLAAFCLGGMLLSSARAEDNGALCFSTDTFTLRLSADGKVAGFDAADGGALLKDPGAFAVLRLSKDDPGNPSSALTAEGDTLLCEFSTPEGEKLPQRARFRLEAGGPFLAVELAELTGGDWYALEFARVPLTIDYDNPDGYGATAISAALGSIPLAMPGMSDLLGGKTLGATFPRGAKILLIAAPKADLRGAIKTAAESIAPGAMPVSRAGGPWAAQTPKSRGNYIITGNKITDETAGQWIDHLKKFGIDQIDFHQGGAFRQGDFVFDPEAYPGGVADFKKMTDRLRASGMIAGFHTYAEFLSGDSKYVTPVPHPDLDVMEEFTLAEDITDEQTDFAVEESTADVSTITGFFVRNSLVLRVDDELIKFGAPNKEAPFGFGQCQRGAFGTVKAPHQKGAKVRHMTHMFGLFAPRADSELFLQIARETAQTYNEGGFSMIYLDALDGTGAIAPDPELVWFYDTLFVNEIIQNCVEPPLIEYSTMNNNIWLCRSRMGAWDSAHRGYRDFFNRHFQSNHLSADRAFLPGQIGWLALAPAAGDDRPGFQKHTLFPEDIHYLGTKTLARGYGYSLLDVPLTGILPAAEANGEILARYDKIRRAGGLGPETLRALNDPDRDFVLIEDSGDRDQIVPARYQSFEISPEERTFSFENPYRRQRPYIRIENRYDAGDYQSPDAVTLLDFNETPLGGVMKAEEFDPTIDLSRRLALGLWVFGTVSGTRYNLRIDSPKHMTSGHLDHFFADDFTGWRYIVLTRAQNGEGAPADWPYSCGSIYDEFREMVHYDAISSVRLMADRETPEVKFRSVKALELKPYSLVNPKLTIAGESITFPVEIPSGYYLQWDPQCGDSQARVMTPDGAVVDTVTPEGDFSMIPAGAAEINWEADTTEGAAFRAKLTVRTVGEPLSPAR